MNSILIGPAISRLNVSYLCPHNENKLPFIDSNPTILLCPVKDDPLKKNPGSRRIGYLVQVYGVGIHPGG